MVQSMSPDEAIKATMIANMSVPSSVMAEAYQKKNPSVKEGLSRRLSPLGGVGGELLYLTCYSQLQA